MNNFKERNIILQKCIVETFNCMATTCNSLDEKAIECAMKFFIDSIGNPELTSYIKEMLLN